ncbi:DUF805 domain-containing protein [Metabacillus sp. KIGAM252]|uniref:DUF805 domain-containing protein n=1 Tax=Metabacillus flavus TaxID=2823519 RepID=A0ABS5LA30_9BACI|nr:DUF805 domain-containing protein [Metabacillus flavus]MBS2967586.1 DUF805 domain-containing protein [Metabacillus flavus]
MEWYLKVVKNYVNFQGRARRKEYWMFTLFSALISLVLSIVELIAGLPSILTGLYSLALLLPGLGVFIRRMHDTGRTGWWILIGLVPVVGAIVLLVFACQDSQPNENKYGANPKAQF